MNLNNSSEQRDEGLSSKNLSRITMRALGLKP